MSSVTQILLNDNWRELISSRFPGCDLGVWEKARKSLLTGQPKRHRCTSRRSSKANQVAAQGRAMAAMVSRVNEVDRPVEQPIPFRGEPSLDEPIEVDMSIEQDW